MFEILAKFFRFSGRENGNKFKLSMVIGLVEALASAMKIPSHYVHIDWFAWWKTDRKIYRRFLSHYGHCDCDCCYM